MYKIAVVDDDKNWCYAIQRFFRKEFEIFSFNKVSFFLDHLEDYDLVFVDYSIPCAIYEDDLEGCELIRYLKRTLKNPPLVVLMSAFVSKNDVQLGKELCPEADAFFPKDAGLDEILQKTKQLLNSRYPQSGDTKD